MESTRERKYSKNSGVARASMEPGICGGRIDGENVIGRAVVNLAITCDFSYLTITEKLTWLCNTFVFL